METTRHIDTLTLWKDNPRAIKEDKFNELKNRIKKWGQFKPLIITLDGVVLGGNMRLRAYQELGITDIWVSVVNPKTEAEKIQIALADNEEMGFYQEDELAELISKYKDDIELSNYSIHLGKLTSLQDLLDQYQPTEIVEDEVPDVPDEPESKLGEVYQLGRHRLMCGDSTNIEQVELLMNGQKADMVFTDPPYGMNLDVSNSNNVGSKDGWKSKAKNYSKVIGDDEDYNPTHLFTMFLDVKEMFLWGFDYYAEFIPDRKDGSVFVWDKRKGVENMKLTFSEFELCWSKEKHLREMVRITWSGLLGTEQEFDHKRHHPTQKPVGLSVWFIEKFSKDNETVVDLFGGSGSTLIACEQLNRTCYMCELDEKYVDVIRKRYWKFVNGSEDGWEKGTPAV